MTEKTKARLKSQGRCIFCDGTGLSKEHIWSDWLKGLMPRSDEHGDYWKKMGSGLIIAGLGQLW